ncbi:MAG: PilZ domain-containing protein [Alphaproteobacteria bacterium]|nr:PilZ domain-containing protein [Alphaproteobacteria bacterium]
MALAESHMPDGHSAVFEALSSGPDNRAHDRYVAQRTGINVDRQRFRVFDISKGGLRMQAPPDFREPGAEFSGLLTSKAGGADIRVVVRGRVVRVEGDGETVGVAFRPMAPSHEAAVGAIIQMLERLEIESAFEKARTPKKSPPWLRVAVSVAVFGATFALAALYLTIR